MKNLFRSTCAAIAREFLKEKVTTNKFISEAFEPDWLIAAGAFPSFCSMKRRLGVFLLPMDGMVVHRRSLLRNLLGFPSLVPILYCESYLPKNTTQCPRPGLKHRPLDPGTS